jgi:hypothetical protein
MGVEQEKPLLLIEAVGFLLPVLISVLVPITVHFALQLLVLAVLSRWFPKAGGIGFGALLVVALKHPVVGALSLILAILCLGVGFVYGPRTRILTAGLVLGVGLVLALKQWAVVPVFAPAAELIPWCVLMGIALGGGFVFGGGRYLWGGLVGVLLGLGKLGLEGELAQAERLGLTEVLYEHFVAEAQSDLQLGARLVGLVPDRDEAAELFSIEAALNLGWRPVKAEGRALQVARALEERGRGGEAWRFLKKQPRVGAVDSYMAILERTQGLVVRWKGSVEGLNRVDEGLPWVFETNGFKRVEFYAEEGERLRIAGVGSRFERAARLVLEVDSESWLVQADTGFEVKLGPLERGPHRLGVRFMDDASGEGGDRNMRVERVELGR